MVEQYLIPTTVHERALMVRQALALTTESAGREAEHALEQIAHYYGDDAALTVIQQLDPLEWSMIVRGRAGLLSFTAELLAPAQIVSMLRAQFLLLASIDSAIDALALQREAEQVLTTLLAFASPRNRAEIERRGEVLTAIAHDAQAVLYTALPFIGADTNKDGEFTDDSVAILARIIQTCQPLWHEVCSYTDEFGPLMAEEESDDGTVPEISLDRASRAVEEKAADSVRDREFAVDGAGELRNAAIEQGMASDEEPVHDPSTDHEELPRQEMADTEQFEVFLNLIGDARKRIMAEKMRTRRPAKVADPAEDMFRPLTS